MNYLERKTKEINLMRSWVNEEPSEVIDSSFDILNEKIRLIRLCAAQEYSRHQVMLTNIKHEVVTVLGEDFFTSYTRQGGVFREKQQFPIFYAGAAPEFKGISGEGYFLKTGQATNFVTLLLLQGLEEDIKFEMPSRAVYFETYAIQLYLKAHEHRPVSRLKGLFIDSGLKDLSWIDEAQVRSHDLVIFDTTCFSASDPEFSRILKLLKRFDRTTFLTRSHLKLDSMGVEYGGLGSIFIMNPNASQIKLSNEIGGSEAKLERLIRKLASIVGVHAEPREVYPFLNEPNFVTLNHQRIVVLKYNMTRVEEAITAALAHHGLPEVVSRYGHRLYCKVQLSRDFGEQLKASFTKIQKALGRDIHYCDSFGYDFLGLSFFTSADGIHFLRITSFDTDMSDDTLRSLFVMVFGLYAQSNP